MYEDLKGK